MDQTFLGLVLCCLLVRHVTSELRCPAPCSCEHENFNSPKRGMPTLVINCRRKSLTSLPDLHTVEGEDIYRIYLDRNEITGIPDKAFIRLRAHGIDFSHNPITSISENAFEGIGNGLRYLSLSRTKLAQPPKVFLHNMPRLEVLDLSGIVSPVFMTLPPAAFGQLPSLRELVLKNTIITSMDPLSFSGVESLHELRLEGNGLQNVPAAIRNLTSLASLHLDHNSINAIPNGTFNTLKYLQHLSLSGNLLSESSRISIDSFPGPYNSLEELNLNYNLLTDIPSHLFPRLKYLQKLYLSGNSLTSIADGSLAELDDLLTLDISGNKFSLSEKTFTGVEDTLEVLLLEKVGLSLETLPLPALRNMRRLRELRLNGNSFPSLPNNTFKDLGVRKLGLAYCGIARVEAAAFEGLKSPVTLDLNNNLIRNITFVNEGCHFDVVELFRNPVRCDCHLRRVARLSHVSLVGECDWPASLKGTKLGHLAEVDNAEDCSHLGSQNSTVICGWHKNPTSSACSWLLHIWCYVLAVITIGTRYP